MKNDWISVENRLPKKPSKYIVFMPRLTGEGRYAMTYYENGEWGVGEKVTHWMPLPESPKEK